MTGPVIGISAYVEPASWAAWRDVPAVLVPLAYVRHVRDAGGLPVLLPPLPPGTDEATVSALLARVDGVVLAGGVDVEPGRYDAEPHPTVQAPRPDRDSTELVLARLCAARDVPLLGVCRGMQVMAVAAGGRLEQHLPDRIGHDGHAPAPGTYGEHLVRTVAGTRLAAVLGEQVSVPTYHHQGLVSHPGLVESGWAEDGVLEAVEDPDARFRLGVQWHPEVGDDPRLFEALVEAARGGEVTGAGGGDVRSQGRPTARVGAEEAVAVTELGLAAGIRGCLFDLDGVLTRTAAVHNAAWTETFDGYLRERADRTGEPFRPFDPGADYNTYVDGKPRADGVRDFLASRGIELAEGAADDPPGAETVNGVGNRKNEVLLRRIRDDGVEVYDGSVRYVRAARAAGLGTAVVSSSANTRDVLEVTGIADLFDAVVDGNLVRELGLRGKPAPDGFLEGARRLGVEPGAAAVFEDAVSGVAAGRAGGFASVIGVDRVGHAQALLDQGADRVVTDLEELMR